MNATIDKNMPMWMEKLIWMIVPLLFTAVGTLWNTVGQLQLEVQELNSRMSLVVTKDNKIIPSVDSELADAKLRQDVREWAGQNERHIAVLEEQMRHLREEEGRMK